jgi:hypothetical protein
MGRVTGSGSVAVNHLSWHPGITAAACLLISGLVSVWLVSPFFWNSIGNDGRVYYAGARVAARNANPYDQAQMIDEFATINAEARSAGSNRDQISPQHYHYPPVMTRSFSLLAPLGDVGFVAVTEIVFIAAAVAGFELVLAALAWRGRWWPRLLFLSSSPVVTMVIADSFTSLLLLAWGAAFFNARRGRPFVAGLLLALGHVKFLVGVPAAAALLVALPQARLRTAQGFAVGTGIFVAANVLASPAQFVEWIRSLLQFSSALDVSSQAVFKQCCLAGLSAPFLSQGPVIANLIALALVALLLAWLYRRGALADVVRHQPLLLLGVLLAVGLATSPFIHPYDLALEAVPLLALASLPLTLWSRVALTLWALSVPFSLAISLAVLALGHDTNQPWSYGVVLSGVTLLALVVAAAARAPSVRQVAERARLGGGGAT